MAVYNSFLLNNLSPAPASSGGTSIGVPRVPGEPVSPGGRTYAELQAMVDAGVGLSEYEHNFYIAQRDGRQKAENERMLADALNRQEGDIRNQYAAAQEFLKQLPNYQNVEYQGPGYGEINSEYDAANRNLQQATDPYAYGSAGNVGLNELARQQGAAAGRGLLGSSGAINQNAALIQQGNLQRASADQALREQRFARRQSLGTALTGLAQFNQGNQYNSQLQKALQGLSTYGDYYAKPQNAILQARTGFADKKNDLFNQQSFQNMQADRQEQAANRAKSEASSFGFGDIIGLGSKLFGL